MRSLVAVIGCALMLLVSATSYGADEGGVFAIRQFSISGNQLIDNEQLRRLVEPYTGEARTSEDIRKAQCAIENAYLAAGFGTVRAVTPEQELTAGIVRIEIVEAKIKRISVVGNVYFSEANIRSSLPALQEGLVPNLRGISENIQLANETPSKPAY